MVGGWWLTQRLVGGLVFKEGKDEETTGSHYRVGGNTALKCDVSLVIFHRKCNHPSQVLREGRLNM